MKRILFTLLLISFSILSISAQEKADFKKSNIGLDLGAGVIKDYDGFIFDTGIRYMRNFSQYASWNVLNFKAIVDPSDFGNTTTQLMTGIRLTSPNFTPDMSVYGGFKAGCGYNVDINNVGFCYEAEGGVNLTRTMFVGFAYNYQGFEFYSNDLNGMIKTKLHYFACRFGFNF